LEAAQAWFKVATLLLLLEDQEEEMEDMAHRVGQEHLIKVIQEEQTILMIIHVLVAVEHQQLALRQEQIMLQELEEQGLLHLLLDHQLLAQVVEEAAVEEMALSKW
jgi:hypothetical protein